MCRLLGYVSNEERTFADVVGEGFENFIELSNFGKLGNKPKYYFSERYNLGGRE